MNKHSFIISDAINTGWKFTKKYFWTLILLGGIAYIPSFISNFFNIILPYIKINNINQESTGISIMMIILGIIGARLGLGIIKTNIMILEDKKPVVKDLFISGIYLLRLIGGGILAGSAIVLGLIALIIPGIYIATRLSLFQYFIAEGYGAIDAIKASWITTKGGNIFDLIGVNFTYFVIIGLSIIPLIIGILLGLGILQLLGMNFGMGFIEITIVGFFGLIGSIGLLWALPTIMLAQAYVYLQLKHNLPHTIKPIN